MAISFRSRKTGPAPGERDKRRAKRRDMHYPVSIESLTDGTITACVIQDISETGARLGLKDAVEVPDEFILRLAGQRAASRHCMVVWRETDSIGVRFVEEETV